MADADGKLAIISCPFIDTSGLKSVSIISDLVSVGLTCNVCVFQISLLEPTSQIL